MQARISVGSVCAWRTSAIPSTGVPKSVGFKRRWQPRPGVGFTGSMTRNYAGSPVRTTLHPTHFGTPHLDMTMKTIPQRMRVMLQAWGKTDKDSGEFHPLAHHSMDVAAVFAHMLQQPVIRDRLEAAADAPLTHSARQRLAALAFLHDVGKLHPGFQAKGWAPGSWRGPTNGHLKESWAFLLLACKWPAHPFHATMRKILEWGEAVSPLMLAMIAHHGRPVDVPVAPTLREWPTLAHYDWRVEACRMGDALQRWFPGAFESGHEPLARQAPLLPRGCGSGRSGGLDRVESAILRIRGAFRP